MKNGFHAGSPAFRQAVLKSERLRILIVLGIIVVVFLIRSFLTLILWDRENFHLWLLSCALLSLFLLYEFFIYRAVSRAVRSGSDLSAGLRISNVIIETSVPAFALAFIYSTAIDPAYRPLANPSTLLFFIFIILSTLRLDPRLCRFSGSQSVKNTIQESMRSDAFAIACLSARERLQPLADGTVCRPHRKYRETIL